MFFGMEWLIITNIILPLCTAGTIAAVNDKPFDSNKWRADFEREEALKKRRSEMDKIRARRAARAAEKAAASNR